MILNLFPVRVPIGRLDGSGQVLMTPEFARALAALLERVGGVESESLTTVINQLGDVTNIVNSIDDGTSFVNEIIEDTQPLNNVDPFTAVNHQVALLDVNFSASESDQSQQVASLNILLEQAATLAADVAELVKSLQEISIQTAFSPTPFSPVPLAPDAGDLPTVIALANTLKQALKSNGVGS